MGKRSNFKRRPSDLYRTPYEAVLPLADFLPSRFRFAEPCAGNGKLVDHLRRIGGTAENVLDQVPGRGDVMQGNALSWIVMERPLRPIDFIISNTPWRRDLLHAMIAHFMGQKPTWLLFDADWIHTAQEQVSRKHGVPSATDLRRHCRMIVSVGRVKWIEGSKHMGKDNCCWYLFDAGFYGRPEMIGA